MDGQVLSSNWKKLQQSFSSGTGGNGSSNKSDDRKTKPHVSHVGPYPANTNRISKRPQKTRMNKTASKQESLALPADGTNHVQTEPAQQVDEPEDPRDTAVGKYIALDCEMVGTFDLNPLVPIVKSGRRAPTRDPEYSLLARVSVINYAGNTIYDCHVLPPPGVKVSDYRTPWSGITAEDLRPGNPVTNPKPFETVQQQVKEMLKDRILVGHALSNDLAVLGLTHSPRDTRDTSRHPKYKTLFVAAGPPGRNGKPQPGKRATPSLKRLALAVLGLEIQAGPGHSSAEDARAAMLLFKHDKAGFELESARTHGRPRD